MTDIKTTYFHSRYCIPTNELTEKDHQHIIDEIGATQNNGDLAIICATTGHFIIHLGALRENIAGKYLVITGQTEKLFKHFRNAVNWLYCMTHSEDYQLGERIFGLLNLGSPECKYQTRGGDKTAAEIGKIVFRFADHIRGNEATEGPHDEIKSFAAPNGQDYENDSTYIIETTNGDTYERDLPRNYWAAVQSIASEMRDNGLIIKSITRL